MGKRIFQPALTAISGKTGAVYGPMSFQDYLKEHRLPAAKTAASISIDSYERLPIELRNDDAMVLRLGSSPKGTGTQFVLVKLKNRLRDFFLFDSEVFANQKWSTFIPTASMRNLFPFQLLPVLSESSLVNLAIVTGLMSSALGLEERNLTAPATGQSIFTFELRAHSSFPEKLIHASGQVEIDALFTESRGGRETLFILECKAGDRDNSLAKHKLVYPVLALAPHVPHDMPIVPVYMKASNLADGVHFQIAECEFPDPRGTLRGVDELTVKKTSHLVLPMLTRLSGQRKGWTA